MELGQHQVEGSLGSLPSVPSLPTSTLSPGAPAPAPRPAPHPPPLALQTQLLQPVHPRSRSSYAPTSKGGKEHSNILKEAAGRPKGTAPSICLSRAKPPSSGQGWIHQEVLAQTRLAYVSGAKGSWLSP